MSKEVFLNDIKNNVSNEDVKWMMQELTKHTEALDFFSHDVRYNASLIQMLLSLEKRISELENKRDQKEN